MNAEDGKRLLDGAVLLTFAALISKVLSIGYRIPYQNITGDIGYYIYQQVYPFYGIAFILAMYGFPSVISKLVSERASKGDPAGARHVLAVAFWLLASLGILSFLILYFMAPVIARFVGDPQLVSAYRMISFPFLFLPFISVLRGMFQAEENMLPTAMSQIAEQCVRVVAIVCLCFYFMYGGYGVYAAGAGAAFGSVAGGAASVLVLLSFLRKRNKQHRKMASIRPAIEKKKIIKQLLFEGFIFSVSSLALIFFQFVDALTIFNQLKASGFSDVEAKMAKGMFDRGQPLLQLGLTVATSLSLVIVPFIVKDIVRDRLLEAAQKAGFALKISFISGLAASVGLFVIIEPTNMMLFKDTNGSSMLAILGITIVFSSVALTAVAVLQAIGKVRLILFIISFGLLVKIFMNTVCMPLFGIEAAAVATVAGFAGMSAFSVLYVNKKLNLFKRYRFYSIRISLSAIGMAIVTFIWKTGIEAVLGSGRMAAAIVALSSVVVAVLTYFSLLFVFRTFTKEELTYFPKVGKLTAILKNK
ncbi:hypothetical protein DCC39_07740 [Pueribacillus theae]|uniref:Uncharacterized protein n=1 Tax=Pueribacillus theae TaxID=2171751 RepID=A0A2U1K3L4_9BACI|nr:polysaccharide biosynthesis protein [Pueribacillus theae]PWA12130.1 hypothetical protein DCC39_07740 [Pueribacillus theae]